MNSERHETDDSSLFHVRLNFLGYCAAFIAFLSLFLAIKNLHVLPTILLLLATLAILVGWIWLIMDGFPRPAWMQLITLITAIYLVISLPVFLFEMSQVKWFMAYPHHSWLSSYARLWVHWGYVFIIMSIICSFFGKGRARVGLVTGAVLLMANWAIMGTWVY